MDSKTHKNTARVDCRWAIGLLFTDGLMFVTKADNQSKYFCWESGKEPLYFESKRTADDYAFGMAVNGYPAVVIEIPASFNVKNRATHSRTPSPRKANLSHLIEKFRKEDH